MSPERIAGAPASVADDLYAVGVVGFEAMTGRRAYPQDNPATLAHAIMSSPPPSLAASDRTWTPFWRGSSTGRYRAMLVSDFNPPIKCELLSTETSGRFLQGWPPPWRPAGWPPKFSISLSRPRLLVTSCHRPPLPTCLYCRGASSVATRRENSGCSRVLVAMTVTALALTADPATTTTTPQPVATSTPPPPPPSSTPPLPPAPVPATYGEQEAPKEEKRTKRRKTKKATATKAEATASANSAPGAGRSGQRTREQTRDT